MTRGARREALAQTARIADRAPQAYAGMIHLQERCRASGGSQRALSRRLMTTAPTVNNWCQNRCSPPGILLPAIAEALGCTIAELFIPPEEDSIDEFGEEAQA